MTTRSAARLRFQALIRQPEAQFSLAEAALCIAWEDQGSTDVAAALQELDALAHAARERIQNIDNARQTIADLNGYLFAELGFCGNYSDYDNPHNSFLDHVLRTRSGLPITLCIIYMEIGWRLGLPLVGVALPGHFLARYTTSQADLFIDPFNQGRLWSQSECTRHIRQTYSNLSESLLHTLLQAPGKRAILARMLRNLKHTYLARAEAVRALAAIERLLLIDPHDADERRNRGLLRAQLGQNHSALEDLDSYASLAPDAPDLPQVQKFARTLIEHMADSN
jgi:regulator of sirC expression with transglutaminase-like and TPR domain